MGEGFVYDLDDIVFFFFSCFFSDVLECSWFGLHAEELLSCPY